MLLLACLDELFLNNYLDIKDNDEHALDVALHLSLLFYVRLMFFPPNACLITAKVSVSLLSEICTIFYAVPLSDPSRNPISPDTLLQKRNQILRTSIRLCEIFFFIVYL
jgi:hypothetical protein